MPKPSKSATTQFGRWLAEAMTARGWKQTELAHASALGQSTIASYLSGVRKPRRAADVEVVARALFSRSIGDENYSTFKDAALLSAGFAPDVANYTVVRERGPEYIYEPILKDIEKAAELGNLDAEAVRRIRRQIQIETEEAARRREESKE